MDGMTHDRATNSRETIDVLASGASGDGRRDDTLAVQSAINHCARQKGGVVRLRPGVYRCGTLNLRSNVELRLEAGATLLGSPYRKDYTTQYNADYDVDVPGRKTSACHLICATNEENIAIRGRGVIDGNSLAFFGPVREHPYLPRFTLKDWRPGHMLAFCGCRNVVIEGVQLVNAPTYTVWPYACQNVRIHGVTIRNHPETPNGDGIDPEACKDVLINYCDIDTADDCVALYCGVPPGSPDPLRYACERVVVTNCTLRSRCHALRLGPHGDAPIRGCSFRNLVIGARKGIGLHAYQDLGWKKGTLLATEHGPSIEDIAFSDIVMKTTQPPIYMEIHEDAAPPACIRNIRMSGLRIESRCCANGRGSATIPIEGLKLKNVTFTVSGAMSEDPFDRVPYPFPKLGGYDSLRIPHALYFRNMKDFEMEDVRVSWKNVSGPWRHGLVVEDVDGLRAENLAVGSPPTGEHADAAVSLANARNVSFRRCRARTGTRVFLNVAGDRSDNIRVADSDLKRAERAYSIADDLPEGTLQIE